MIPELVFTISGIPNYGEFHRRYRLGIRDNPIQSGVSPE